MELLWCTDIHLNFLQDEQIIKFGENLNVNFPNCEGLIISGDISESQVLLKDLNLLQKGYNKKIYFVIGNHDYINSSFDNVHTMLENISNTNLIWLRNKIIDLGDDVCIVGHDGWYDGGFGNAYKSKVIMCDWDLIADFLFWRYADRSSLLKEIGSIAKNCANEAFITLTKAAKSYKQIIFVSHYPPYKEACCYQGKQSDDNWLPWFSSRSMGEALDKVLQQNNNIKILSLVGHTHSSSIVHKNKNHIVLTGHSQYYKPTISGIINSKNIFKYQIL